MYYLAELKDGANVTQFKTALSRNGMKYREDKKFPKFLAIRSSRTRQELMTKYEKYAINIALTTSSSLIEVIELLYVSQQQAPAVIKSEPIMPSTQPVPPVVTEMVFKEPDAPTLTSQPEPVKKRKFEHILSLVFALIGRRTR